MGKYEELRNCEGGMKIIEMTFLNCPLVSIRRRNVLTSCTHVEKWYVRNKNYLSTN